MALASLILSFFSLIVPFGIAAVVLGHVSRSQIANSGGRLRGTGVAFAGLIVGYLQLAAAALLFVGALGLWREFNRDLDKNHYARAALVEWIKYGDPYKVTAADNARHQQDAEAALRIIRERQREYRAAHPDEGYACQLYRLDRGSGETELHTRMVNSRYDFKVYRCSRIDELSYVVLAEAGDAPSYCLDSTDVIRKYVGEQSTDAGMRVHAKGELCPQDGERVEQ